MQIKMRYRCTPLTMAKIKNTDNAKGSKDMEQKGLPSIEKEFGYFFQNQILLLNDPPTIKKKKSLFSTQKSKLHPHKTCAHTKTCSWIFIVVLFTVVTT